MTAARVLITVIIPTLDEAGQLPAAVQSARAGKDIEIIVADGGSSDGTAESARHLGVHAIVTPPGRARQMNAAAAMAAGKMLLFLHADTRLPPGFDALVRQCLARPGVAGGAFSLRIDAPGRMVRWIEAGANRRSRRLRLPYGDQAIFLPANVFRSLGGFPDLPIMEDFVLVRRLGRRGKVVTLDAAVLTSGRRWRDRGILRPTLINQLVVAGFYLGIAPERLARWYRGAAEIPCCARDDKGDLGMTGTS
jgi:rSAM/selenodomain-associated transferase 2